MAQTFETFSQTAGTGGISSATVALNTSGINRILVLFVHTDAATRRSVTSVSGGSGLTWALYTAKDWDSEDTTNHKQRLEIWWAYAAAQQTSQTITVNLSGNSNGPDLAVGAITGVDPSRYTGPFDADPSEPAFASNPSSTFADAIVTFSTHDTHTAQICVYASDITTSNTPSTPSGYTQLVNLNHADPTRMITFVYGKIYSAQQVNTSVDMGNTSDWGVLAFAIGGDTIFPHSQVNCAGF